MNQNNIHPEVFTNELIKQNLGPVIQVPCSYFKSFIDYLFYSKKLEVISPVNEAIAMGIAAGMYLATGDIPIVAVQNSGFLNSLNALTSLHQIYSIPLFYIITWRGEGKRGSDVPVHDITGLQMKQILKTFLVPYEIFDPDTYSLQIELLTKKAQKTKKPVALILKKNSLASYKYQSVHANYPMDRYEAMHLIKDIFKDTAFFISSTGFPSRDSFTITNTPDFYMLGSMGHALSIALGLSPNTKKRIVVMDGDGSSLMQLGGLASFDPKIHTNLLYIVFDNEQYESTGGQPTLSATIDFKSLAKAFRFPAYFLVNNYKSLQKTALLIKEKKCTVFLHIKIKNNTHDTGELPSTVYTCPEIKERFISFFKKYTS